ncbi:MAG: HEPN domain-containing protein [Candidatus Altiarchaeales archaeon]|nr:HEPN domain-containing protein [Candidatus Altiarchaeales archaeon]
MRPEIERWILQAKEELDTAKVSLNAGKWFAAAFWSQQAAEKALKALFIIKKKESPGPTHSLTYLGRELKVPNEYYGLLRELTKEYYMSRYPDASEDVPYQMYTKEDAESYVKSCGELIKWAESKIQK